METKLYRSIHVFMLENTFFLYKSRKCYKKTFTGFCFICVLYLQHWFDQNHHFCTIKRKSKMLN